MQSPSNSAMSVKCSLSFLPHSESTRRFGELTKVARCGKKLASFPGLPTVQFYDHLQATKNWTVGRPGNEASKKSLVFIHKRLLTSGHFHPCHHPSISNQLPSFIYTCMTKYH